MDDLDIKIDDQKNRSMRNNLCFHGLKEDANESWSVTGSKVKDLIIKKLLSC